MFIQKLGDYRSKRQRLVFRALFMSTFIVLLLSASNEIHAEGNVPNPEVELMPGTTYQWLARDIVINGVPASIRSIKTEAPFNKVLAHYRTRWQSGNGVVDRPYGAWRVLATRDDDRFISLQLKPSGQGTEGILTVSSDPLKHSAEYNSRLPMPHDLSVLSWQSHRDGADKAQTITLTSDHPVGFVRESMVQSFQADGWRMYVDQPATTMNDGHSLRFSSDLGDAHITIGRDTQWSKNTLVLIVWTQS